MPQWRNLRVKPAEVAARVKHFCGEPRQPRLALLIGAGCSISAGIPAASRIVSDYLRPHPLLASAGTPPADKSEYAYLMSRLSPRDRMQIINICIEMAYNNADPPRTQLNWAHLLVATLVNHGYVRQILTTNFDPLLVDAMAITGQPVRTFDLTAADWYMPGRADRGSIMYLHGQAHGLLQAHTSDDTDRVRPRIRAVLQEALAECTMIVIGYSGLCDPVFDELRDGFPQFRDRLYWCHYDPAGTEPPRHLVQFLESPGREAFLLVDEDESWMSADRALYALAVEGLKLPLLPLVADPLRHLHESLSRLCGTPPGCQGQPPPPDTISEALRIVAHARQSLVSDQPLRFTHAPSEAAAASSEASDSSPISLRIHLAGITGDAKALRLLQTVVEQSDDTSLKTALGDGFMNAAAELPQENWRDRIDLLEESERLGISEPHWLAAAWGCALFDHAKATAGDDADQLFTQAYEKFAEAVRIKPNMHEAWYNWGTALVTQAKSKSGVEADRLFTQGGEKYAEAVKIKSDSHEALNNWGNALSDQAKSKEGAEADRLFTQAGEKYAEAVRLKPDKHEAWYNWGTALSDHAKLKRGAEADRLFALAGEKYVQTVRIKPDMHMAWHNWGTALADQAMSKVGLEADRLFTWSGEKYAEAVRIKPDKHEAWCNWGTVLLHRARSKTGAEADLLFAQAGDKYAEAQRLKPDDPDAFFNMACLASLQRQVDVAIERLRKWAELDPNAGRKKIDEDSDFDTIRHDPAFQAFLATLPP